MNIAWNDNGGVVVAQIVDHPNKSVMQKRIEATRPDGVATSCVVINILDLPAPPENCLFVGDKIILNAESVGEKRKQMISDNTRDYILSRVSQGAQNKAHELSIVIHDKLLNNESLTDYEIAARKRFKAVRQWMQAVREVGNAAEADGTLPEDVVYPE